MQNLFAQQIRSGTVWLNNYDSNNPIYIWDIQSGRTNLAPVAGTFVQVLYRRVGSAAVFQVITNGYGAAFRLGDSGFFEASFARLPGVPERTHVEIIVRAWNGVESWEQALRSPSAFAGQTPIFENPTGTDPPVPDFPIPAVLNAPSFTMYPVPELCSRGVPTWPPLLCSPVKIDQGNLLLRWTDVGTNYVYTLEASTSLAVTNWSPVAGGSWPARTNQWVIPVSPEASRYYRVKAEKQR